MGGRGTAIVVQGEEPSARTTPYILPNRLFKKADYCKYLQDGNLDSKWIFALVCLSNTTQMQAAVVVLISKKRKPSALACNPYNLFPKND